MLMAMEADYCQKLASCWHGVITILIIIPIKVQNWRFACVLLLLSENFQQNKFLLAIEKLNFWDFPKFSGSARLPQLTKYTFLHVKVEFYQLSSFFSINW